MRSPEPAPESAPETASAPTETPAPAARRRRKRLFAGVLVPALLLLAAGGGLLYSGYDRLRRPGPLLEDRQLVIPRGVGLNDISGMLAKAHVIDDPLLFRLGVELFGGGGTLRAGEYRFGPAMSALQVMQLILRGETVLRRVTLAEGLTTTEMLRQLDAVEGLEGAITLAPREGRLLPETYYFSYGDQRDEIVRRMTGAMRKTLDQLWPGRAPDLPLKSKEEALVLASIIEKETSVDSERGLVASVFVNRLKKGMRLQSDPTVVYGITNGSGPLGRPLLRSELDGATPFNTYVISGLPPGPIANPGRASIEAALSPAETSFLYFVADGNGGHAFARTFAEHQRNVDKWRRIQQRQRRRGGG